MGDTFPVREQCRPERSSKPRPPCHDITELNARVGTKKRQTRHYTNLLRPHTLPVSPEIRYFENGALNHLDHSW